MPRIEAWGNDYGGPGMPGPPFVFYCALKTEYRTSLDRVTLFPALLAPRHIIYTGLEGALLDAHTGSFAEAEEALSELSRRHIPLVLVTSRTRDEIEPLRRKLGTAIPSLRKAVAPSIFGWIFQYQDSERHTSDATFAWHLTPYKEVCEVWTKSPTKVASACRLHHMSAREIAENTGVKPRERGACTQP